MPFDEFENEINIKLDRGTQIVYVPPHMPLECFASWLHRFYPNGAQPGFVTSGPTSDGSYFCRYWSYDEEAKMFRPVLRTAANSECTPGDRLIVADTFNQYHVRAELERMDNA